MHRTWEDEIVIDESYILHRCKYSQGRVRNGGRQSSGEAEAQEELEIELRGWGLQDPARTEKNSWVVGLPSGRITKICDRPCLIVVYKNKLELRFFVRDRKDTTPYINC